MLGICPSSSNPSSESPYEDIKQIYGRRNQLYDPFSATDVHREVVILDCCRLGPVARPINSSIIREDRDTRKPHFRSFLIETWNDKRINKYKKKWLKPFEEIDITKER